MEVTDIMSQLERDEGRNASAYQDSLGFLTIGIGTCIDVRKGCGLTDDEMEMLLADRLESVTAQLKEQFPWVAFLVDTDPPRLGVMQNMAYAMGMVGLEDFHIMTACMSTGDYAGAKAALLDSKWAREQAPERAGRLALQLETGEWQ